MKYPPTPRLRRVIRQYKMGGSGLEISYFKKTKRGVIHKKVGRSKCGMRNAEFKTKNRIEHGAKGITRVFVFLLAKDLSFILEK